MKLWRKCLVAINILMIPIIDVLVNVLAANFPALPQPALWSGGIAIFIIFVIVSVVVVLSEDKADEAKSRTQDKPAKQSVHPSDRDVSKKSQRPQRTPHPPRATHYSPNATSSVHHIVSGEPGQPTVDKPLLLCMAIDVSRSMKKPIMGYTGDTIERWATVKDALEEFVYIGAAWINDPGTQRALPLYRLMAYGFGFREFMHNIGVRKTPGGAVRDLLAHPSLPSLPSASDLSKYWDDYKEHLMSVKEYTGDLFGLSPLCQALEAIRDRIKEERQHHDFITPILLLIISDGLADDGDPLPLIAELQALGVITLSCYLADKDVLAPRQLYDTEDPSWTDGAKLLFRCASPIHKDTYVSQAIFDYLEDHSWHPSEGVHLFVQANQAEALGNFLQVLLQASVTERSA